MLPLIPADKANHAIYGAALGALAAMGVALARPPVHAAAVSADTLLLCAAAAAGAGLLAGLAKEWADSWANRRAVAAGQPPPHSVERADVLATALGAGLVAVPLCVAGLLGMGAQP